MIISYDVGDIILYLPLSGCLNYVNPPIGLQVQPLSPMNPAIYGLFQAAGNRLQLLHPKQFEGLANLQALWNPWFPATLTTWLAGAYLIYFDDCPSCQPHFPGSSSLPCLSTEGYIYSSPLVTIFNAITPQKHGKKENPPLIARKTPVQNSGPLAQWQVLLLHHNRRDVISCLARLGKCST